MQKFLVLLYNMTRNTVFWIVLPTMRTWLCILCKRLFRFRAHHEYIFSVYPLIYEENFFDLTLPHISIVSIAESSACFGSRHKNVPPAAEYWRKHLVCTIGGTSRATSVLPVLPYLWKNISREKSAVTRCVSPPCGFRWIIKGLMCGNTWNKPWSLKLIFEIEEEEEFVWVDSMFTVNKLKT